MSYSGQQQNAVDEGNVDQWTRSIMFCINAFVITPPKVNQVNVSSLITQLLDQQFTSQINKCHKETRKILIGFVTIDASSTLSDMKAVHGE